MRVSGRPAATSTTRPAAAATAWFSAPARSRKARPSAVSGTRPRPDLVGDRRRPARPRPRARAPGAGSRPRPRPGPPPHEPVGDPHAERVHQEQLAGCGAVALDRLGQIVGRLDRDPAGAALQPVALDAAAHLVVEGDRRRHEDAPPGRSPQRGLEREAALAAAAAADHE
ncbi:MAG: hypothetical protein MZV70_06605 [Desulfobacterales bacterium]|nr:hypothetical protein [Desulfobacterales bacterium]